MSVYDDLIKNLVDQLNASNDPHIETAVLLLDEIGFDLGVLNDGSFQAVKRSREYDAEISA